MYRLRQARGNPKMWKQHTDTTLKRISKVMGETVGVVKTTFEKLLEMGGWWGSVGAFLPIL